MYFDKFAIYVLFAIISFFGACESYKFLGILPTMYRSHFIYGNALMQGLANNGHEVHVISPFPQNVRVKNYYDIPFKYQLSEAERESNDTLPQHEFLMVNSVFESYSVKKLMNSTHKFDAIICESTYSDALFGFSEHFNATLIVLSPFGHTYWNTEMMGSPSPPSYVPDPTSTYTDHMSYNERLSNFVGYIKDQYELHYGNLARQNVLYKKHFKHLKKDLYTVRKNVAAILINANIAFNYPVPYMPNEIPVGGLHLRRWPGRLPEDLEKFISEAEHGVIYFSMGTHSYSSKILEKKTADIFHAFRRVKQRVIWKHSSFKFENKKIRVGPWFPQQDILAHKNVKVFITQGGLLSVTESIYYGKPMVGIPVHSDQYANMDKAERAGFSFNLDYQTITESEIVAAATWVIKNDHYSQNAKEMSFKWRDQPIRPLDLATYWVEHVVREKGAKYLRSAGLDLNFVQFHNFDVGFVLFLCFLLVLYPFYLQLKRFVRKMLRLRTRTVVVVKKDD